MAENPTRAGTELLVMSLLLVRLNPLNPLEAPRSYTSYSSISRKVAQQLLDRIDALEADAATRRIISILNRGRPPMDLRGLALSRNSYAPSQTVDRLIIVASTNNHRKRIKYNEPSVFTGPLIDIRLQIIEINNQFNLQLIDGLDVQALIALIYLGSKLKTRTSLMRLTGQRKIFEDQEKL